MSDQNPKPRPPKVHRPWGKSFPDGRGPDINGSRLTHTSSSTQGFLMPVDRIEQLRALLPKDEEVK